MLKRMTSSSLGAAGSRAIVLALTVGPSCLAADGAGSPATRPATGPATAPASRPAEERVLRFTAEHPDTKEQLVCLVDITASPEAEQWGSDAGRYALKWYPAIEKALATDGYTPTRQFRLLFKPMPGVAHASGTTITINTDWIKKHPDDLGMVAHELTHVIQKYRRGGPGWLTEGLADYVRYYVVEPGSKRAGFNVDRTSYKNAYQPAAGFLDWLERTKGPGVVAKLNAAMRAGTYKPETFKEAAGGDPDELWEAFKAEKKAKK